MKIKITNRQFLSASIIIFYLIPLLFFSSYSIGLMPHQKSWAILSLGLLTVACGTLTLLLLVYYWEESIQTKQRDCQLPYLPKIYESEFRSVEKVVESYSPQEFNDSEDNQPFVERGREAYNHDETIKRGHEKGEGLQSLIDLKDEEIQKLSFELESLKLIVEQTTQDYADYKLFSEEQLKQKQMQLSGLQQVIDDQKSEMETRQEQIHQLDSKIHDLSYEIKTLLYLNDEEKQEALAAVVPSPESLVQQPEHNTEPIQSLFDLQGEDCTSEASIKTPTEAAQLLRKCINIAQKLTGVNYFGNEISRYRELATSHYTIDHRRLFDSLRVETRALILVYSQKELKVLFANNQSKPLLGWAPDKLASDFSSIFQPGIADWKKLVGLLSTTIESQGHLLAKTKFGQELLLNCHLGVIPTGLFRHYVVAVLYPT